jgi:hypothetical protein
MRTNAATRRYDFCARQVEGAAEARLSEKRAELIAHTGQAGGVAGEQDEFSVSLHNAGKATAHDIRAWVADGRSVALRRTLGPSRQARSRRSSSSPLAGRIRGTRISASSCERHGRTAQAKTRTTSLSSSTSLRRRGRRRGRTLGRPSSASPPLAGRVPKLCSLETSRKMAPLDMTHATCCRARRNLR